jgi:KDO2-lipid IV(A) lauroyltransferase
VQVHEEVPVPAGGDSKQKAAAMMQEVAPLRGRYQAHPQDWHMLQRVFVADLDPERLPRAAGS